jgi:hypothetical protein
MGTYQAASLSEYGFILGRGNLVILEPGKWTGKRFPLLPYVEDAPRQLQQRQRPLRQRLAEGDWRVVLFHHDCPICRELIAALNAAEWLKSNCPATTSWRTTRQRDSFLGAERDSVSPNRDSIAEREGWKTGASCGVSG